MDGSLSVCVCVPDTLPPCEHRLLIYKCEACNCTNRHLQHRFACTCLGSGIQVNKAAPVSTTVDLCPIIHALCNSLCTQLCREGLLESISSIHRAKAGIIPWKCHQSIAEPGYIIHKSVGSLLAVDFNLSQKEHFESWQTHT